MKTTAKFFALCSLGIASASLLSNPALAQNTPPGNEQASTVVGFGIGYVPEYLGAKKHRAVPILMGEYNNGKGFFVSSMRGIGMETNYGDFKLSGALGFRAGRDDSRNNSSLFGSDDLKGMGDLSGVLTGNLEVSTMVANTVKVYASTNLALSKRDYGHSYKFGFSPLVYQSKNDQIALDLSAEYGDAKFNQTYFGVTPKQSASSAYKVHTLKAGFNQVSASVAWNHVIDSNWSVHTMVGVTQLTGDVADSPIVKKKTNPMILSTVNYRF